MFSFYFACEEVAHFHIWLKVGGVVHNILQSGKIKMRKKNYAEEESDVQCLTAALYHREQNLQRVINPVLPGDLVT